LSENKISYLSAGELFNSLKMKVLDETSGRSIPQNGVIQGSGHEGGDFIFVKRK
jgi:hypothetical protein